MLAGLDHAHEGGVVHSDFKPGNVFVSSQNQAKILDFGIARAVQVNQQRGDDTVFDPQKLAALTPAYASWEMLKGDNPDTRDDIYSLGVVIYLVLTGHHPYGRRSAVEAEQASLVPERIRRVSRRQWKVIESCLAFNRVNRPSSVSLVQHLLTQPSPWRSRTAYVAAAAFVFALALGYVVSGPERSQVEKEVRQTTLVDSQVERLENLLKQPRFDESWQRSLHEELQALAELDGQSPQISGLRGKVLDTYSQRIAVSRELDDAIRLYDQGLTFGELPEVAKVLEQRMRSGIESHLEHPVLNDDWLTELDSRLIAMVKRFPEGTAVAELNLETVNVLERLIEQSVSEGNYGFAQNALSVAAPKMFDVESYQRLTGLLSDAQAAQIKQESQRQRTVVRSRFESELNALLNGGCLRMDVAALKRSSVRLKASYPGFSRAVDSGVSAALAKCVVQLGEIDFDRAQTLRKDALNAFGAKGELATVRLDPCSLGYLVGKGAQSGRGGYCVDEFDKDVKVAVLDEPVSSGPRLIVAPGLPGSAPFAITKYEVSWAHFNAFCAASGTCEQYSQIELPVTNVGVKLISGYAKWLSATTKFSYRLPTLNEWQSVAIGEVDANRNCRVNVGGVERGLNPVSVNTGQANSLGVLNLHGNVQEIATDGDNLVVLGGAYDDPIAQCVSETVRPYSGVPNSKTGFRLVRTIL